MIVAKHAAKSLAAPNPAGRVALSIVGLGQPITQSLVRTLQMVMREVGRDGLAVNVLNRMLELGAPRSEPIYN